ncbi:pyridoxamine 5'-phosphate oxidase family protein [Caulobacter sp. NIBR2454]|uniref:pyridoxamine 5'-phosphate oxidase family protein n=1 Tax=Caulobacter sp. NIBR2454 TaxID=3015996 RepID=UPI0022B65B2E|nr:pyridoxamine 5'-phosphate oxidase family protein [Caulobacter sp. NIBR2454]
MSTDVNDKAAVEKRLWKEIDDARFGMLGLSNSDQHFQPMTAYGEPETGKIWFFTLKDTDLARAVENGKMAMFTIQSKDGDFQACIGGQLIQQHDRARIDKYWNPIVAAWYPDGKDDARLTLLCLDAEDAAIWISKGGPVKFLWEVAKANATKTQPDMGGRANIDLH